MNSITLVDEILKKEFKLALIQLKIVNDKIANIKRAKELILQAALEGNADIVVLPECFNSPYGNQYFKDYAESIPDGETMVALSKLAEETEVYIIGGSITEKDVSDGNFYNSCVVFDPKGNIIAKYRKLHLFDVDLPGDEDYKEDDVFSPGNELVHFDTPFGKIALGICYDFRFPDIARIAREQGCIAIIYPSLTSTGSGPLHWEILQRSRALDNQIYVAGCAPANNPGYGMESWGHSIIVDPMGKIVATSGLEETIVYGDIKIEPMVAIRKLYPTFKKSRRDVFIKYTQ